MAKKHQRGEFLLRFAISSDTQIKANLGLVLYQNVLCIQTFTEKNNCIQFITEQHISYHSKPSEHLYKRGYISKVINELPESFIQVSQSAIINLNYLSGRSAHSLEIANTLLISIGAKHRKNVDEAIRLFLSISHNTH